MTPAAAWIKPVRQPARRRRGRHHGGGGAAAAGFGRSPRRGTPAARRFFIVSARRRAAAPRYRRQGCPLKCGPRCPGAAWVLPRVVPTPSTATRRAWPCSSFASRALGGGSASQPGRSPTIEEVT